VAFFCLLLNVKISVIASSLLWKSLEFILVDRFRGRRGEEAF